MIYKLLIFCIPILLINDTIITPESYVGKWEIKGGSIIEIYKKDNMFFGKIFSRAKKPISNLNGLDNKNPIKELRARKLLGMDIINNLSFEDGELSGGTIYNADSGRTYTVKVWISGDDVNLCYIRAYKGFLFKTFEAMRVF